MTTTDTATLEGTLYLGRTPDRSHVYVTVTLRPTTTGRSVPFTDHTIGLEPLEVSVTGAVLAPRAPVHGGTADPRAIADGWVLGWGQTTADASRVLYGTPALPLADAVAILEAWDRWHLNRMRAGCEHHHPAPAVGAVGECPEGYAYGSAWLAEAVPAEVLANLERIILQHRIGGAE